MKTRFIVTYDICDPKRLRKVFKKMVGSGDRLQLSVFRCDLTMRQKEVLQLELDEIIMAAEDQVLFIELGPSESRIAERINAVGRPYKEKDDGPLVF